jgi:hypothetical protein
MLTVHESVYLTVSFGIHYMRVCACLCVCACACMCQCVILPDCREQERLPFAEEVLVTRADLDEKKARTLDLEAQVGAGN